MKTLATVTLEAGRIAIPEEVRAELGLVEGQAVNLGVVEGRLVVETAPGPARLVEKDGAFVLRGPGPLIAPDFDPVAAAREARDRAVAFGYEIDMVEHQEIIRGLRPGYFDELEP